MCGNEKWVREAVSSGIEWDVTCLCEKDRNCRMLSDKDGPAADAPCVLMLSLHVNLRPWEQLPNHPDEKPEVTAPFEDETAERWT